MAEEIYYDLVCEGRLQTEVLTVFVIFNGEFPFCQDAFHEQST